jgi:hypothetical protein
MLRYTYAQGRNVRKKILVGKAQRWGANEQNNVLFSIFFLIDSYTFQVYMFRIFFWTSGEVYFAFFEAFSSTILLYEAKSSSISKKLTLFKEPRDS